VTDPAAAARSSRSGSRHDVRRAQGVNAPASPRSASKTGRSRRGARWPFSTNARLADTIRNVRRGCCLDHLRPPVIVLTPWRRPSVYATHERFLAPPRTASDPSSWDVAVYAFLAEKERRFGSRRTMEGYSRMLRPNRWCQRSHSGRRVHPRPASAAPCSKGASVAICARRASR